MLKAVSGSPGQGMTLYVPPAVENAAVPVVTTPTGAGQSVGHPSKPIGQSNLDLTRRRIVRRGDLVSWNGFRGRVGLVYPEQGSPLYINVGSFVACRAVQVVQ